MMCTLPSIHTKVQRDLFSELKAPFLSHFLVTGSEDLEAMKYNICGGKQVLIDSVILSGR